MTDHILQAYETDIDFRIHGFEKANESGYRVEVTEIESGIVYRDDLVTVEAFPVSHGTLECYGYKFTTPDRTIVITGDTAPLDLVAEKSKGCDILLHEVEYAAGISCREPKMAEIPPGSAYVKHGSCRCCKKGKSETARYVSPDLPYECTG